MDAIETLMSEHRTIEGAIAALLGFAGELCRRGGSEQPELARFVTFLREFADAHHHAKEEDLLFEAMVSHGFPRHGGPIAVMLREHDLGRAEIAELRRRAEQAAPWTDEDRAAVADAARAYADLLHAHIHKEDAILYPMAEQHLPPDALAALGEACARFEAEPARRAARERLAALAEDLVARHAPGHRSDDTPRPSPRLGCCG
jgi:hemerythrin-like domain-containing protein